MNDNILGLDVSTSIVGASLIDPITKKLNGLFYVDLKKEKGLINKAIVLRAALEKNAPPEIVSYVAIEEPLVAYKDGYSSAQVLSLLSQFNGMVQVMTFFLYNTQPIMYNVSTARKLSYPDLSFPRGVKRKKLVLDRTVIEYPELSFPVKRTGSLKDECYDMADAIVIGRAQAETMRREGYQNESNS